MEILWWLAPAAVATTLAMLWASWVGRESHGSVDGDEAVARIEKALRKEHPGQSRPRPTPVRDRSTGIAVRPSRGSATRTDTPDRSQRRGA